MAIFFDLPYEIRAIIYDFFLESHGRVLEMTVIPLDGYDLRAAMSLPSSSRAARRLGSICYDSRTYMTKMFPDRLELGYLKDGYVCPGVLRFDSNTDIIHVGALWMKLPVMELADTGTEINNNNNNSSNSDDDDDGGSDVVEMDESKKPLATFLQQLAASPAKNFAIAINSDKDDGPLLYDEGSSSKIVDFILHMPSMECLFLMNAWKPCHLMCTSGLDLLPGGLCWELLAFYDHQSFPFCKREICWDVMYLDAHVRDQEVTDEVAEPEYIWRIQELGMKMQPLLFGRRQQNIYKIAADVYAMRDYINHAARSDPELHTKANPRLECLKLDQLLRFEVPCRHTWHQRVSPLEVPLRRNIQAELNR